MKDGPNQEHIDMAVKIVSDDGVSMFASEEDLLLYQHFVIKGIEAGIKLKRSSPKAKKKPEHEEYSQFVEIWVKQYPLIGIKMPRDGRKINSIISQVKELLPKLNVVVTPETCIQFWQIFVQSLHTTWGHNKDLCIIDSKFVSLIMEIKNGKRNNQKPSASRIIDSL